jgi:hypothetical protein
MPADRPGHWLDPQSGRIGGAMSRFFRPYTPAATPDPAVPPVRETETRTRTTRRGTRAVRAAQAAGIEAGNITVGGDITPARISSEPAAAIVGITPKTLLKMARAGKIPGAAEVDKGLFRFDETALRRWLRQKESRECQTISSSAGAGGMRGSKLTVVTSGEAYARLLKLKR